MKRHANVAVFIPNMGCAHRCSFCGQREVTGYSKPPSPGEAEKVILGGLKSLGERARSSEIAFFGGSFTSIPEDYMLSLLKTAKGYIGDSGFAGIRVSARPDAISERILDILSAYGVSSIELGAQSMDDGVLAANNRGHTAGDVKTASKMISRRGIQLGLHMMTGLYKSGPERDTQTARELAALNPQTVRIHPTLIIKRTELERLYNTGEYSPQTLDEAVSICAGLLDFFDSKGIMVIRMGLHSAEALSENIVAGPYHPAFRELCEGRLMLERVIGAIKRDRIPPGRLSLYVAPGAVSKMAGQKRVNISRLRNMGYDAAVIPSEGMGYLEAVVRAGTEVYDVNFTTGGSK